MEDKYKLLSAPELAGEDSFIRWVTKGENNAQWQAWQQLNVTTPNVIEEARIIVNSLTGLPADSFSTEDKDALWNKIKTTITDTSKPARRLTLLKWSLSAAATLALVVWINTSQPNKVLAYYGEQKEVMLPESSSVIVNATSQVTYKDNFAENRTVKLKGEAFFSVKPGSTFRVITDQGTVTVLGTSFNVIDTRGHFEVSCYTGKVRVESEGNEAIIISPGEKGINENGKLEVKSFTPNGEPGWTEGKFSFEDQPLSVVVAEFERQFGVDIKLAEGLDEMRYTGLFEKGDLDKALYMITWPLHLQSEIKGKIISITR